MFLLIHANEMHLIMGAVSLWTRPPGPVPVCRAPRNSSHQLTTTPVSCPMSARQRACQQPCPGTPGNDDFLNSGNCEISTVSTTTAPGNNDVLNESNGELSTVSSTTAPGTCKPACTTGASTTRKSTAQGSHHGLPNRENRGLSTMTGMSTTSDERQQRHQQNLSRTTTGK